MSIRLHSIRAESGRIRRGRPLTVFIEVKRESGTGALTGTVTLSSAQSGVDVRPESCEVRIAEDSSRTVKPVQITLAGKPGLESVVVHATLTDGGPRMVQSCLLTVVEP